MISASAGSIMPNTSRIGAAYTAAILLCLIFGTIFLLIERLEPAILCLGLPLFVFLISYTRAAVYLYILCILILAYPAPGVRLTLIDMAAITLLISCAIDFLLKGKTILKIPPIAISGLILLAALGFTALFARYPEHSYSPILRVALQLAIIIALYNFISLGEALNLMKFYFWLTVVHSAGNFCAFVALGGGYRIFGLPGVYFDDLAMLAFPIGLAYFIWSEGRRASLKYALGTFLIIMGLLGTQSRGPVLTAAWVGSVIAIYSWIRARKERLKHIFRRLRVFFWILIPTLVLTIVFGGIFKYAIERFHELGDANAGTVWLRFSLWKASLMAFMDSPLTGIGPGNFRYIASIFPSLKFDVAQIYVLGFSAHNMFLHYLAEGGIIGASALTLFYLKNFVDSIKTATNRFNPAPVAAKIALFGVGLTIFGTIFYMDGWAWGPNAFAAPLFFAITAHLARVNYNE
jgi:O-antigen ligase